MAAARKAPAKRRLRTGGNTPPTQIIPPDAMPYEGGTMYHSPGSLARVVIDFKGIPWRKRLGMALRILQRHPMQKWNVSAVMLPRGATFSEPSPIPVLDAKEREHGFLRWLYS